MQATMNGIVETEAAIDSGQTATYHAIVFKIDRIYCGNFIHGETKGASTRRARYTQCYLTMQCLVYLSGEK